MGLVVVTEEVLDAGTGGCEPDPQRRRLGGGEREAVEQRGVAVVELAGGDQHPGPGEEQLDARLGRRGVGQEA